MKWTVSDARWCMCVRTYILYANMCGRNPFLGDRMSGVARSGYSEEDRGGGEEERKPGLTQPDTVLPPKNTHKHRITHKHENNVRRRWWWKNTHFSLHYIPISSLLFRKSSGTIERASVYVWLRWMRDKKIFFVLAWENYNINRMISTVICWFSSNHFWKRWRVLLIGFKERILCFYFSFKYYMMLLLYWLKSYISVFCFVLKVNTYI